MFMNLFAAIALATSAQAALSTVTYEMDFTACEAEENSAFLFCGEQFGYEILTLADSTFVRRGDQVIALDGLFAQALNVSHGAAPVGLVSWTADLTEYGNVRDVTFMVQVGARSFGSTVAVIELNGASAKLVGTLKPEVLSEQLAD